MTTAGTPASVRAFATGASGTGKTRTLTDLFLARQPRALLLDYTGEWAAEAERQGWPVAGNYRELVQALRHVGARKRWRVVAGLDGEARGQLARLLVPATMSKRGSYSLAVGGMALLVDEVADFAGRDVPDEVAALWRRGRHVALSLLAATQRPAACARVVTSQSQWLFVCALHEPLDLKYVREACGPAALAALAELPQYGCLMYDNQTRRGWLLDAARNVIRPLTPTPAAAGAEI